MALTIEEKQEINQLISDFIVNSTRKVSNLPNATTLDGLSILGVSAGISVKASIMLLKGLDGKNLELRKSSKELQWRIVNGVWQKLIDIEDIRGYRTMLQKTPNELQWKFENNSVWNTLIQLAELKGASALQPVLTASIDNRGHLIVKVEYVNQEI